MARGRPSLTMTTRRRQVLEQYADMAAQRQPIRWAELARRCQLYSYNDARRIVRDLERMGAIKYIGQMSAQLR